MDPKIIFLSQLGLSVAVVTLLMRWYARPWLAEQPARVALGLLVAPHAFRHIGLSFLAPGLTEPGIPAGFAQAAAYGDLLSGVLAVLAIVALRAGWGGATAMVWVFSVVGIGDLAFALSHAEAIPYLGTTWYIPTFIVPVLLVTHVMVVERLLRPAPRKVGCREGSLTPQPAAT